MNNVRIIAEERLTIVFQQTARALLFAGAAPWEIDEALEDFGFAMGPFERRDNIGIDIVYAAQKQDRAHGGARTVSATVIDRMVQEGRLGRKASVGWYRYPGGEGQGHRSADRRSDFRRNAFRRNRARRAASTAKRRHEATEERGIGGLYGVLHQCCFGAGKNKEFQRPPNPLL